GEAALWESKGAFLGCEALSVAEERPLRGIGKRIDGEPSRNRQAALGGQHRGNGIQRIEPAGQNAIKARTEVKLVIAGDAVPVITELLVGLVVLLVRVGTRTKAEQRSGAALVRRTSADVDAVIHGWKCGVEDSGGLGGHIAKLEVFKTQGVDERSSRQIQTDSL